MVGPREADLPELIVTQKAMLRPKVAPGSAIGSKSRRTGARAAHRRPLPLVPSLRFVAATAGDAATAH